MPEISLNLIWAFLFMLYCALRDVSSLYFTDKDVGKATLAKDLAFLVDESSNLDETKPKTRVELKRLLELRIKKRFQDLKHKVVADLETLQDAYDSIIVNSNVDLALEGDCIPFEALADELSCGYFNVNANSFSISTKGAKKEVLVLPNVKLKVVQKAIRIVLEVVYRPHFSKISHGCRSGRGHLSALKYISKEISNLNWWFTFLINKKLDTYVLDKLISTMEVKIEDPSLFAIIKSMFDAQVLNLEFGGFPKGHGLPQEGVLSPILMNLYLDLFDPEFYRISMKYETLDMGFDKEQDDVALAFKSEMQTYLEGSFLLGVDKQTKILPCNDPHGMRFLGTLISTFRKAGLETDHWYKLLLMVWMQDTNAKFIDSEEYILSKCIAEPSLPQELRGSFYEFQNHAEEYISSETASLIAFLPNSSFSTESVTMTKIIAPVRKSCIRTLAAKYRIHENEIEMKFDSELSRIPSTPELEHELANEKSDS
ncbi:hypothetical protein RHSIM_Rhsim10G0133500 [Rhododendron simsii]|uniref:Reverse transcriptase domain-containing protein n=1 Tax=Rhododendron simsii TaxID=118357 RepID=A0A834GBQ5_RHOSS|nr:hypothetical protein RHSIM_Rhsim10G0133500 [Rhododendron simsii]